MDPSDGVLSGLLSAAPDALLAVDAGGAIVFVSDQAEQLFGWAKHELIGRAVETLIPARVTDLHRTLRSDYVARPVARQMGAGRELSALAKDGTEFPVEISLSAFSTPEETLVAVAIRDVTLTRRAEQRLRALLAAYPDALIGVDVAGRIELVNGQAARLFGWSADELIGQPIEVLVPESVVTRHVQHRSEYLLDPESRPMGADRQLSARRRDGSTFIAEISLSPVTEEPGSSLVLAAVRDITDRIEAEANRVRRDLETQRLESLGQLAGGVAHDFNNLLGVILNYATLVARRVTDQTAADDIGQIRAAAERGAALTRQLLTFARRDQVHPEVLDVAQVVRGVATLLAATLGEHIALSLDLGERPVTALCDRTQLEQILLNLAINARDAMAGGGTLTIGVDQTDTVDTVEPGDARWAMLTVTDTGHGMSPDVLARAFEPFFTTKPRGRGTGLGLATVYGIASQHGGEVRIASKVGSGTSVTVALPGVDGHRPAVVPIVEQVAGGTERVLLVEDEDALRLATSRLLTESGYRVVTAGDGVEALAVIDRERGAIDIVVTDVAMPRMRGDELARRLGSRAPDLPVIFTTGYDSGPAPVTGRVLSKPVVEKDLLMALREVLDG